MIIVALIGYLILLVWDIIRHEQVERRVKKHEAALNEALDRSEKVLGDMREKHIADLTQLIELIEAAKAVKQLCTADVERCEAAVVKTSRLVTHAENVVHKIKGETCP